PPDRVGYGQGVHLQRKQGMVTRGKEVARSVCIIPMRTISVVEGQQRVVKDYRIVEHPTGASSETKQAKEDRPRLGQCVPPSAPGRVHEDRDDGNREHPVLVAYERSGGDRGRTFHDIES